MKHNLLGDAFFVFLCIFVFNLNIFDCIFNGDFHKFLLILPVLPKKLAVAVLVLPFNSLGQGQFLFVLEEDQLYYFEGDQEEDCQFYEVEQLLTEIGVGGHMGIGGVGVRVEGVSGHFIIYFLSVLLQGGIKLK